MNNLTTKEANSRSSMFLFFVIGLFMMQILFAFTIHGDIGPQSDLLPILGKPASPNLIGRIDSLVSETRASNPAKVKPEGAFSPATKKIRSDFPVAVIDSEVSQPVNTSRVRKIDSNRYYEYRVQSGDTLGKISKRLYGNNKMIHSLVRINRVVNYHTMRAGSALKVPQSGLLKSIQIL